jgi:hypothetical protein
MTVWQLRVRARTVLRVTLLAPLIDRVVPILAPHTHTSLHIELLTVWDTIRELTVGWFTGVTVPALTAAGGSRRVHNISVAETVDALVPPRANTGPALLVTLKADIPGRTATSTGMVTFLALTLMVKILVRPTVDQDTAITNSLVISRGLQELAVPEVVDKSMERVGDTKEGSNVASLVNCTENCLLKRALGNLHPILVNPYVRPSHQSFNAIPNLRPAPCEVR